MSELKHTEGTLGEGEINGGSKASLSPQSDRALAQQVEAFRHRFAALKEGAAATLAHLPSPNNSVYKRVFVVFCSFCSPSKRMKKIPPKHRRQLLQL